MNAFAMYKRNVIATHENYNITMYKVNAIAALRQRIKVTLLQCLIISYK